jgi:hypothetical protein
VHNCAGCRKAYHTVVAYNGCYQWKISHESLVEMSPIPSLSHPECSNIVEVSSAAPREFSQAIWLSGHDLRTHRSLRAEIRVARIHRLEIFSRSRQFSRGDNQHIEVRAVDAEGNSFSSQEGFKFDWTILSGHENIMRIKPQEAGHSKVHQKHSHDVVDEGGINDDDFFAKGLQSGVTHIKVMILEKGYEDVPAAYVNVTVVEPFEILRGDREDYEPIPASASPPYILPTSEFPFKLAHLTMAEDQSLVYTGITIPSPVFTWELS